MKTKQLIIRAAHENELRSDMQNGAKVIRAAARVLIRKERGEPDAKDLAYNMRAAAARIDQYIRSIRPAK